MPICASVRSALVRRASNRLLSTDSSYNKLVRCFFGEAAGCLVSYSTLAASRSNAAFFAAVVRANTLPHTSRGYFTIARQRCAPR